MISELEAKEIIPRGSRWARADLEQTKVTVDVRFLSTDFETLDQIAVAARLHIQVPVGQHGELRGPIDIRDPDEMHKIGAWGHHFRLAPS